MDVRRFAFASAALALIAFDPHLGARDPLAQTRDLVADAAERRDLDAVRTLLKKGADPNAPQPDGATALHWAVHWDDLSTAEVLIKAGARLDAVNDLGVFALSLACSNGSSAMVKRLIAAGASVRAALPSGESAVMTCARTGAADAIRGLAERGADVNARETHRGQTALMWAAGGKHPGAVKVLVERGADVNAVSTGGFTPLMFAAREGDPESTRLLLAAGGRLDDTTPAGETALLLAAASVAGVTARDYRLVAEPSGHEAVAIRLVDRGANVNHADTLGQTALHHAVETAKPELLKALIARGANLDARLAQQGLPFRRGDYVSRAGFGGATRVLAGRDVRRGRDDADAGGRGRRLAAAIAKRHDAADGRCRPGPDRLADCPGGPATRGGEIPRVVGRGCQRNQHGWTDRGPWRRRHFRPFPHRLPCLAGREPGRERQGRTHAN